MEFKCLYKTEQSRRENILVNNVERVKRFHIIKDEIF